MNMQNGSSYKENYKMNTEINSGAVPLPLELPSASHCL